MLVLSIEMSNLMACPEMTALGYDLELIPDYIADKTGMDVKLVRSEGEREQKKAELVELAAQAIPNEEETNVGQPPLQAVS